jgi:hypothetical protein
MRARRFQALVAVPLIAGALAGCGDSGKQTPKPVAGKTLRGETETGMALKIDTFVAPSTDPKVKMLDDWRASGGYPKVDYHRVTADNTTGQVPDSGRLVTFAKTPESIAIGQGIKARFSCDALQYEWLPTKADGNARWNTIRKAICADGPPKQEGIAPGARQVYYLITDRTFAERGLRTLRVFGPRDTELK